MNPARSIVSSPMGRPSARQSFTHITQKDIRIRVDPVINVSIAPPNPPPAPQPHPQPHPDPHPQPAPCCPPPLPPPPAPYPPYPAPGYFPYAFPSAANLLGAYDAFNTWGRSYPYFNGFNPSFLNYYNQCGGGYINMPPPCFTNCCPPIISACCPSPVFNDCSPALNYCPNPY